MSVYREDVKRYVDSETRVDFLRQILTQRGLWALLQYRLASAIYRWTVPTILKRPLIWMMAVWHKLVELTTGIQLPYTATIGPGLYIGHVGRVFLEDDVIIGSHCNMLQGVAIVRSGRGDGCGVPTIGDRVHFGPNATVAGKIRIGDDTTIAANALVITDMPSGCSVAGIPAEIIGRNYPRYFPLETKSAEY
ncbi:MAG: serine acetyltransferase [Acidobacteria bacterium]|nr:serine acetyltransferase [Acidobacteriota bacterium]